MIEGCNKHIDQTFLEGFCSFKTTTITCTSEMYGGPEVEANLEFS